MGDIVVGQELLLGYLMNVLDEEEVAEVERELASQPKLRNKLATLQKQLYSLDNLFDSTEPPSDLSRRTCDSIWATAQNENVANNLRVFSVAESDLTKNNFDEQIIQPPNQTAQLDNILPTTSETSETFGENVASVEVADAVLDNIKSEVKNDVKNDVKNVVNNNVEKPVRLNRRRSKNVTEKQPRGRKNLLLQITVSAVIGIVLAVILYPAAIYLTGQVIQLVVRQKVNQLDKSVDVYTQLSDPHVQTSPEEINLTRYGWQELLPSTEYIFANDNNQSSPFTKISDNENPPKTTTETETFGFVGDRAFNIIDEHALILNLSQPILISEGSKIKPAIGQNILIQNDRIFFRILPQANDQNK
ncbi:MAG: hypothetical protein LBL39_03670 [Planctomycetaceae bacterium]|jgi:hypothetical protein|nr:hypothetical protein [Planctomycetaceae bacterium]